MNTNKCKLIKLGENLINIANQYTHPIFEDFSADWHEVSQVGVELCNIAESLDEESIINKYLENMESELLKGNSVELSTMGKLEPKFRKVRNDFGKEYSIGLKFVRSNEFRNKLIESYEEDKERFK